MTEAAFDGTARQSHAAIAADNTASDHHQPRQPIAAIANGPTSNAKAVASGM